MSRLPSGHPQRAVYQENLARFDEFDDYGVSQPQPQQFEQEQRPMRNTVQNSENIRLYVSIKKSADIVGEYKKLILMTSTNIKISLLKRQIEREFTDLFPKEQTFICGKVEDQYGYALSNSSFVYEMLKFGDRITAFPDDIVNSLNNPSQDRDGAPELHTSGDISEILYLMKNVQQSLCKKLADGDIKGYSNLDEVLLNVIPLGFSPSRVIVHNVAVILIKAFSTERLFILEGRENGKILNILVTMLNFWIGELLADDNFLLGHVVNLLEILVKSAAFCESFKGAFVISNLMNASNLDFVSSQTKSRLIKIITYLSKGNFKNYYNPDRNPSPYVPSMLDRNSNQSRGRLTTNNQMKESSPVIIYDSAYEPRQRKDTRTDTRSYICISNPGDSTKTNNPLSSYFDSTAKTDFGRNASKIDAKLYKEYVSLLTLGNTREMHIFAIQNLDLLIDKIIHDIMDSKEDYLLCLNLVEIELPGQWTQVQLKILNALDENLTEIRAVDGLQKNIVPRLLKAMSYQSQGLHVTLVSLLQSHLVKGKYRIDVSTVISIILSPYSRLHDFAIKALSVMSDPSVTDNLNYDIQFENHMKLLIELTLSKNKSFDFKNIALKTLANLSLKENLKAQILYNRGLETLIYHLRNEVNLEGQRLASKALLNLSTSSRDIKLRIITEISDEIKRLHKNELDPIIQGYLQTLVSSSR